MQGSKIDLASAPIAVAGQPPTEIENSMSEALNALSSMIKTSVVAACLPDRAPPSEQFIVGLQAAHEHHLDLHRPLLQDMTAGLESVPGDAGAAHPISLRVPSGNHVPRGKARPAVRIALTDTVGVSALHANHDRPALGAAAEADEARMLSGVQLSTGLNATGGLWENAMARSTPPSIFNALPIPPHPEALMASTEFVRLLATDKTTVQDLLSPLSPSNTPSVEMTENAFEMLGISNRQIQDYTVLGCEALHGEGTKLCFKDGLSLLKDAFRMRQAVDAESNSQLSSYSYNIFGEKFGDSDLPDTFSVNGMIKAIQAGVAQSNYSGIFPQPKQAIARDLIYDEIVPLKIYNIFNRYNFFADKGRAMLSTARINKGDWGHYSSGDGLTSEQEAIAADYIAEHSDENLLKSNKADPDKTEIVVHRGEVNSALGIPENSLAAIDLALSNGVHNFEIDIQVTHDGVPIVFHDFTAGRMTGDVDNLPIGQVNLKYMKERNLTILDPSTGKRLATNQKVPTLAEALEHILEKDQGASIWLDTKGTAAPEAALHYLETKPEYQKSVEVKIYMMAYHGGLPELEQRMQQRDPKHFDQFKNLKLMPVAQFGMLSELPPATIKTPGLNDNECRGLQWVKQFVQAALANGNQPAVEMGKNASGDEGDRAMSRIAKHLIDEMTEKDVEKPLTNGSYRFEDFKSGGKFFYYGFDGKPGEKPDKGFVIRGTPGALKNIANLLTTDLPMTEAYYDAIGEEGPRGNPRLDLDSLDSETGLTHGAR